MLPAARALRVWVNLACASACGAGDTTDQGEVPCESGENSAPAKPAIRSPAPGTYDIVAGGALTVRTSAFDDGDVDDRHVASELEIWRVAGGEPVTLVWTARRDEPDSLTDVTLADGTWEVGAQLDERAIYQVTARHRDAARCSAWSEWSAPRTFRTDDGSLYWFGDEIREVRVEIPSDSWDAIDAEAVPPDCVPYQRSYHTGAVTLDGERFDGVGIRGKGGCGSARHLDGKAGFKINLGWDDPAVDGCPDERRSNGLERLTLNNMVQDGSFVHEQLAYRFYRLLGVPAPRANHVRLFVNDELWGVYNNVETTDRRLLWRWFDDSRGMLYEGTYWCDLLAENIPPGEEDTTDYCISREFSPDACSTPDPGGDPETFAPIRDLVTALDALPDGGFYPEIEQLFDFDTFLAMWAVEEIIHHWDGYVGDINNNYRVYHDPSTGRWTILPSGVDQTFGDSGLQVDGLLAQRCMAEDDCRAAYRAALAHAVDVFEEAQLGTLAASIRDRIAADVEEDPRKEVSYDGFMSSVSATIDFIAARPAEVRAALEP